MEKRIILAFVISMVLISVYNTLVLKKIRKEQPVATQPAYEDTSTKGEVTQSEGMDLPAEIPSVSGEGAEWVGEKTRYRASDQGIFGCLQEVEGAKAPVELEFDPPVLLREDTRPWKVNAKEGVLLLEASAGPGGIWVNGPALPQKMDLPKRYAKFYQGLVVNDGRRVKRIRLNDKELKLDKPLRGVGVYSKYYLAYVGVERGIIDKVIAKQEGDWIRTYLHLAPEGGNLRLRFYAGLFRKEFMKGLPEANRLVKGSVLSGITHLLWLTLKGFYRITKNWGLAIVLLAVTFSLVFMPLTLKSYTAMKRLQAMQPEMKALQERYKDDPQRLNQELIMLYAKYKVNPFSGCLPLLLQLPVFFALYPLLLNTYELKGAGFLWIKDLSRPDVLFTIGGLEIHLLPILVSGLMVIQQRTSTATAQGNQAMLWLFPALFLFIFYNLPSGLVLFWLVMSLFNAGQQVLISRMG